MTLLTVLWMLAGGLATVAVLLVLARIITGPTLIDRLIASDIMLTTLILVVGAEMVISGHTRTIPLMVVLAATGILGSVAVARFVSRAGAEPTGAQPDESQQTGAETALPSPEGGDDERR